MIRCWQPHFDSFDRIRDSNAPTPPLQSQQAKALQIAGDWHTHTTFCDGQDTPADMARAAYDKGLPSFGICAHARHPLPQCKEQHKSLDGTDGWHISPDDYAAFVCEVRRLKAEYEGRMEILCGFEADYIEAGGKVIASPADPFYREIGADYVIGSVHYIVKEKAGGTFDHFTVDGSVEEVADGVRRLFGGDGKQAVCEYFALERRMLKAGGFDIWAHPDLFRKRNGSLHLFDEKDAWYLDELHSTAKAAAAIPAAEINTGGIARGALDDVYPSAEFLRLLCKAGIPVVINSDAHTAKTIAAAFDRARSAAVSAGYTLV